MIDFRTNSEAIEVVSGHQVMYNPENTNEIFNDAIRPYKKGSSYSIKKRDYIDESKQA